MNRFFFVLSVVILIVIGLVSVGLLLWKRSNGGDGVLPSNKSAQTSDTTVTNTTSNGSGNTTGTREPVAPARPEAEVTLNNFIRDFVERYGSYSTSNAYENLHRTYRFMTERFWKEEEKKEKRSVSTSPFYGVTVAVQSIKILEQSSERIRVSVVTQWNEEKGGGSLPPSLHTIELTALPDGKEWKVDRATWK